MCTHTHTHTLTHSHTCLLPIWIQRPEILETCWCKCQSKSHQAYDPRKAKVSVQVWRQEGTNIPFQDGQAGGNSLLSGGGLAFFFYSVFTWLAEDHAHQRGQSALVYWFQCSSHPETPSQTHGESCLTDVWGPHKAVRLTHKIDSHRGRVITCT